MRGLKQLDVVEIKPLKKVAPCVGAWIETMYGKVYRVRDEVAPCVGAWIETRRFRKIIPDVMSHPAWVRGLKQVRRKGTESPEIVAPCVGAWIETKTD